MADSYVKLPALPPSNTTGQRLATWYVAPEVLAPFLTAADERAARVHYHGQVVCDPRGAPLGVEDNPLAVGGELLRLLLAELRLVSFVLNAGLIPPDQRYDLDRLRADLSDPALNPSGPAAGH